MSQHTFQPRPTAAAGCVSWAHIGDLHMVQAGEQNHRDLHAIVERLNASCQALSFVYLPGDNADDGSETAYAAVREALDTLTVPWCAIVGDHDVHEKAFTQYERAMGPERTGSFRVGDVLFLRLNAFDIPRPDSFTVLPEQLDWIERELRAATEQSLKTVLLLHCYPSDLKQGRERLTTLVRKYKVALVDMGHTHYNELANDGTTLYSTTRSTGQLEEGPVGFSIATIDGEAFSWKFCTPQESLIVAITSPADHRLQTEDGSLRTVQQGALTIRARVFCDTEVRQVTASVAGKTYPMEPVEGNVYACTVQDAPRSASISVEAQDANGTTGQDRIEYAAEAPHTQRAERDQDNALGAVPERDLVGTQLGPNKNGRKW